MRVGLSSLKEIGLSSLQEIGLSISLQETDLNNHLVIDLKDNHPASVKDHLQIIISNSVTNQGDNTMMIVGAAEVVSREDLSQVVITKSVAGTETLSLNFV